MSINKISNKTRRKNPFHNRSFNKVVKIGAVDEDTEEIKFNNIVVPKEIIWEIEKNVDTGAQLLAIQFNKPVMVEFEGNEFFKLPKNVLKNDRICTAGNIYNAILKKSKRINRKFYYPNGKSYRDVLPPRKKYESEIIASTKEEKGFNNKYHCYTCKLSFETEGGYISHKESKNHCKKVEESSDVSTITLEENIFKDFIFVLVIPSKNNYYSSSEYRKDIAPGCKHCILSSSICATIGYGNKSSRKTKGRNKRESFMRDFD